MERERAYYAISGYGIRRDLDSCLAVLRQPQHAARRFKKVATLGEALLFVYSAPPEPRSPPPSDRFFFSSRYIE